jgi:hypothetical protein
MILGLRVLLKAIYQKLASQNTREVVDREEELKMTNDELDQHSILSR